MRRNRMINQSNEQLRTLVSNADASTSPRESNLNFLKKLYVQLSNQSDKRGSSVKENSLNQYKTRFVKHRENDRVLKEI